MSRLKGVLREKTGMSLVFVLCATVLLMAIGVSVLVAASTSAGSSAERLIYERLKVYSESVIRTFTYALQAEEDDLTSPKYIGLRFMKMVYDSEKETPIAIPADFSLEAGFADGGLLPEGFPETPELKIYFDNVYVDITPYEPEQPEMIVDGVVVFDAVPERLRRAEVNFTMRVILSLEMDGYTVTDAAAYEYTGGVLENPTDNDEDGMVIKEAGDWRLLSYERLDS